MTDSIDDRLKRVNSDLDELLSGLSVEFESNFQRLLRFGLSDKEAKTWISKEPNYSRRKVTPFKTDEEVTEKKSSSKRLILGVCKFWRSKRFLWSNRCYG